MATLWISWSNMIQVKQIVNSVLASNTYIISNQDDEAVWLVDIGDFDKVQSALLPNQYIKGTLITHCHHDHIYGINNLVKAFPNVILYGNKECIEGLYNDKANFSYYVESPIHFIGGKTEVIEDGSQIELFKDVFSTALYTPGHAPSCVTYKLGNYLFTGDSFIPGAKPVTNLKGGNRTEYKSSLDLIMSNINTETILCPGHLKEYTYTDLEAFNKIHRITINLIYE